MPPRYLRDHLDRQYCLPDPLYLFPLLPNLLLKSSVSRLADWPEISPLNVKQYSSRKEKVAPKATLLVVVLCYLV